MKIAAAGADAAAALARVHAEAFAKAWTAEDLAALLSSLGVAAQAIWSGAAVVGFVMIRVVGGDAEVLTLAVAEHHRRRGLATLLLDAACKAARARGAQQMLLEVAQSNAPALGLYRKAGFAPAGRRGAYYGPEGDALVLRRDLNR